MFYTHIKLLSLISLISLSLPSMALAQEIPIEAPVEIKSATFKKSKIIRKVEPVPYWVDSEQLRIRDNPVAGDVIGMLELGQKIRAYEQVENWIRITKTSTNPKWVNINYLTNTPITWARYGNNALRRNQRRASFTDDIAQKRVKVQDDKTASIYAASVKQGANGNRIIVTRKNFRVGPYFEKRLVACAGKTATHIQMLGEGYTYMMMENDVRADSIDVNTATPNVSISKNENISPTTIAVANFSCEADI